MGRVFVSPLNWGLGHSTRDIPIIEELLRQGHEVTIGSSGNALALLKENALSAIFCSSRIIRHHTATRDFSLPILRPAFLTCCVLLRLRERDWRKYWLKIDST